MKSSALLSSNLPSVIDPSNLSPSRKAQKSFCYTPGVGVRVGISVHVHMQNVRANVKVMKFQSLCIFSCILTLVIILIKPRTTKAHHRRASGDCGTSGYFYSNNDPTSPKGPRKQATNRFSEKTVTVKGQIFAVVLISLCSRSTILPQN